MALLSQYMTFFVSPFGEASVTDELNLFLKQHRIVNVEKKLIDGERGTGWLFLIEYIPDNKNQSGFGNGPKVDYREVLSETEFAVFDKLRVLRKELAEKQGVPVYAIFSNEHLAAMVKNKMKTLKELASINGIGKSRVKQFGEQFLQILKDAQYDAPAQADTPPQAQVDEKSEILF